MREIAVRATSGFVYIAAFLLALQRDWSLYVLMFLMGIWATFELKRLIQIKTIFPYIIFVLLFGGFGYFFLQSKLNQFEDITQLILAVHIVINLLLLKDLFSGKTIPLTKFKKYWLVIFYLISGFIFLAAITSVFDPDYQPYILMGCFILVWVNDTGAYLIGKKFGRQKLFPSVSPKKTVEGFLGGLISALIFSYLIHYFTGVLSQTIWLILAIIIVVFGTFGDLIESKLKRQAKVKDSGSLMPGHGGILDRVDSILYASPFVFLLLIIAKNVS